MDRLPSNLFGLLAEDYMPHGMCLLWDPLLIWLHVVSDLVIAASYFSIPVALGYFAYRRRDMHFRWLFGLFGVFILACGTTHIMGAWTLWHPAYWADALIKVVTALSSVVTAVILWPLIPRALALPSPTDLRVTNARLEAEIGERAKAEQALLLERDFTKAVIDGLPGIFYVITATGQMELWNGNLEIVSEFSAEAIGRMSPMDFFEDTDKALVAKTITGVFANGSGNTEASLVTRTGARIPYYFTGQRLGAAAAARMVGVGIDVSVRRKLENALRQSSEELERFADISAHHLMEPARRLVSFSQRLRSSLAGRIDDPDALVSLNFIEDQAERLRLLLHDVQLYLVADQPLGATEAVDAEQVVKAVIERLASRIRENGANVMVGELPSALIDIPRLSNLFHILIANALQYRRPDVVSEIRIDGQEFNGVVRYRVADNGCGIPAEYRERVFEVFERLYPRSSNESTGIGLSIVRRIVATRGGRTWIEETPGGGTTVIVELPAGALSRS